MQSTILVGTESMPLIHVLSLSLSLSLSRRSLISEDRGQLRLHPLQRASSDLPPSVFIQRVHFDRRKLGRA